MLGLKILTYGQVRSGFKPQHALWTRRFIPMHDQQLLGFTLSPGPSKGVSPLVWDPKGEALSLGPGDRRSPESFFTPSPLGRVREGVKIKCHAGARGPQVPWGLLRGVAP